MKWDDIANHWTRYKERIQQKWGRLTDNDLAVISGQRYQLTGLLRKKYGWQFDRANEELEKFTQSLA